MIVPLHAHSYTLFFFFNDTATTEIYTLSLHDALPIYSAELYRYLDGKDQGAGKRRALFVSWAKRSEEHTSELQSQSNLVCRLLLEKKKKKQHTDAYSTEGSTCVSPLSGAECTQIGARH